MLSVMLLNISYILFSPSMFFIISSPSQENHPVSVSGCNYFLLFWLFVCFSLCFRAVNSWLTWSFPWVSELTVSLFSRFNREERHFLSLSHCISVISFFSFYAHIIFCVLSLCPFLTHFLHWQGLSLCLYLLFDWHMNCVHPCPFVWMITYFLKAIILSISASCHLLLPYCPSITRHLISFLSFLFVGIVMAVVPLLAHSKNIACHILTLGQGPLALLLMPWVPL